MSYTDKERGEYLIRYADTLRFDPFFYRKPNQRQLLLRLYKSRLIEEGRRLLRKDTEALGSLDDSYVADDYIDDPDKFLTIMDDAAAYAEEVQSDTFNFSYDYRYED